MDRQTRERTPLETFEQIYLAEADPWGYGSRRSEHAKHRRTIAALRGRRYRRALEVGSSIGIFTSALAGVCDEVLALEPSASAVSRARQRLSDASHVQIVQGALPEDLPRGPFDLVVCSEVLYYLSEPLLLASIDAIERELAPGGTLLAVHYAPSSAWRVLRRVGLGARAPRPPAPLSGQRVHELLHAHSSLVPSHHERHVTYLLDRFDDG